MRSLIVPVVAMGSAATCAASPVCIPRPAGGQLHWDLHSCRGVSCRGVARQLLHGFQRSAPKVVCARQSKAGHLAEKGPQQVRQVMTQDSTQFEEPLPKFSGHPAEMISANSELSEISCALPKLQISQSTAKQCAPNVYPFEM